MANRLVNNVYIIDSNTTAALPLLGAGSSSWLGDAYVNCVAFWGSDSSGQVEFVYANNTADLAFVINAGATGLPKTEYIIFSSPQRTSEVRVKTLMAGTAWIYLA